jgi:spore germination cell wall hydrolase CwlJ-like protein
MNFFKKLFEFLFQKNHTISKKVYTFGCVIVTTCIVSVFILGSNGYLVNVYSAKNQEEQENISKEKELDEIEMNSENEDEIVLLLDRNLLSHPIMNLDTFQTIQGIDAPSNQKVLSIMKDEDEKEILSTSSIVNDENVLKDLVDELLEGMTLVGYEPIIEFREPIELSETDYSVLLRIVEAEVGSEDLFNRTIIANAIINRMYDSSYPDTIEKVVFQNNGKIYQFSPILDGRYYEVSVSKDTKKAVEIALAGIDNSAGALSFVNPYITSAKNMRWFNTKLQFVTKYGVVEYFKDK